MFAFSRFGMSAYNYILKEEAGRCRKPKTIRYNEKRCKSYHILEDEYPPFYLYVLYIELRKL